METATLHTGHGSDNVCTVNEEVDAAHEFDLPLHIAALVGILLMSTFGKPHVAIVTECRRVIPHIREPSPWS